MTGWLLDTSVLSELRRPRPDAKVVQFVSSQSLGLLHGTRVTTRRRMCPLLDGYLATTHWAFIPCLKQFPAILVAEGYPRFVVDRNRVTGGGISSGLDESLRIVELLAGYEVAQQVQQFTQYYPCPPVASTIHPTNTCPLDG